MHDVAMPTRSSRRRVPVRPSGRWRFRTVAVALLAAVLTQLGVVTTSAPAQAGAVPAGTTQLVTVTAVSGTAQVATLRAYDLRGTEWVRVLGPLQVHVGAAGVGRTREGLSRTPGGDFWLTGGFGRKANPGTAMPWFTTDVLDWWDENPSSPTYNTHVRRSTSPGGASENLYTAGAVYDYAIVIGYNPQRVPGAGSAIFLHVTNGSPTAGCVATDASTMVKLLRWMKPAAKPIIRIRPV
jgi:L,D-peptidoglycan transpeptidase YkuD (ErfK/YbiS/YcfS/YnhG family)